MLNLSSRFVLKTVLVWVFFSLSIFTNSKFRRVKKRGCKWRENIAFKVAFRVSSDLEQINR